MGGRSPAIPGDGARPATARSDKRSRTGTVPRQAGPRRRQGRRRSAEVPDRQGVGWGAAQCREDRAANGWVGHRFVRRSWHRHRDWRQARLDGLRPPRDARAGEHERGAGGVRGSPAIRPMGVRHRPELDEPAPRIAAARRGARSRDQLRPAIRSQPAQLGQLRLEFHFRSGLAAAPAAGPHRAPACRRSHLQLRRISRLGR